MATNASWDLFEGQVAVKRIPSDPSDPLISEGSYLRCPDICDGTVGVPMHHPSEGLPLGNSVPNGGMSPGDYGNGAPTGSKRTRDDDAPDESGESYYERVLKRARSGDQGSGNRKRDADGEPDGGAAPLTKRPRTAEDFSDEECDEGDHSGDEDDEGGNPPQDPPPPPPPAPPAGGHGSTATAGEACWLCTFCLHPLAKRINAFVVGHVDRLDIHHLSAQVEEEILAEFPHAHGARRRDVVRHVREHMLAPNVKMAGVLRSLTSLAETLRESLHQRDPESGDVLIDLKSTDMYLKTLNQISNVYKMDSNKLMFSGGAPSGNDPTGMSSNKNSSSS